MIITITLVLLVLTIINFLLLAFSCNKTTKQISEVKDSALDSPQITKEPAPAQLAPTGS